MKKKILQADRISVMFGGLKAVNNFNIEIFENELIGLIGPNGAGKTTVFNILTGVYDYTEGELKIEDEIIRKQPINKIVYKGIARTFQNIRLFKNLTVIQNVIIANNFMMKTSFFEGVFRLKRYWKEQADVRQKALELLDIFDLAEYADTPAGSLPYGKQRKLEIARALATNPKILLLDEPAAGMNPSETEELMNTLKLIKERFKIAILLIEHDMKLVLGICERLIVLDHGTIIAEGEPYKVINDKKVIKAYLGSDEDEEE